DLVLIEGFKNGGFPKLEIWRASVGKPTLWPAWPGITAIASDTPAADLEATIAITGIARLDLSDTAAIAAFVLAQAAPR
ncbi:MAG: molybdopterin-guanine dinucleotide biosynthesis protein MobB, partial [Rubrivivax sp.]|nr:molybdopterin-guanine dinucleotide biosynthesis protein MobB [Rubrivivax sp.]